MLEPYLTQNSSKYPTTQFATTMEEVTFSLIKPKAPPQPYAPDYPVAHKTWHDAVFA